MNFKFDSSHIDWHQVRADPGFDEFKLGYDYSILGYDTKTGTLDMLMRWAGDGGHCERHRHVGVTSTLVLEGEQHLDELRPDGSIEHKVRRAGDYALSLGVEPPHLERGGPDGGIVLLSMHTSNGLLFEVLDADLKVLLEVSIENFVARWDAR
ncbi:MAG: hypothetical protein H8E78_04400 [Proteobacteria bacterium]|nr:hypothetical protein [Pseudomonadota bacterium]